MSKGWKSSQATDSKARDDGSSFGADPEHLVSAGTSLVGGEMTEDRMDHVIR